MLLVREGNRDRRTPRMNAPRRNFSVRLAASFVAFAATFTGLVFVASPAQADNVYTPVPIQGVSYFANDDNVAAGATAWTYDTSAGAFANIQPTVTIAGTDYAVKTIGNAAFSNKSLTSISIPNSVTTIGSQAFQYNQLTTASIPNSVTTMGSYAFYSSGLTSVTIPSSLTSIADNAFSDNELTSVTVPASVTNIGNDAFIANELTSVNLSPGLTSIGDRAFYNNDLTSLTVPGTVSSIGTNAFSLNDLTSLTLANGVASIGEAAFMYNLLTGVSIPGTVTTIGLDAFRLNSLTSLTLGHGIQQIGVGSFQQNQLTDVTIPASVTAIGARAFEFTDGSLSSVKLLGSAPTVSAAGTDESFDTSGLPKLLYRPAFAAGYTPTPWNGYTTQAYVTDLSPSIAGIRREGHTLTANTGTLEPGVVVTYQWKANGVPIVGAVNKTIKLGKAQAARKITVTESATFGSSDPLVKTSGATSIISSPYKRIAPSSYTIQKGKSFTVAATGLKPYQSYKIVLNGVTRTSGKADSKGTVYRLVNFKPGTPLGKRSVKVYGTKTSTKPAYSIGTNITYVL